MAYRFRQARTNSVRLFARSASLRSQHKLMIAATTTIDIKIKLRQPTATMAETAVPLTDTTSLRTIAPVSVGSGVRAAQHTVRTERSRASS